MKSPTLMWVRLVVDDFPAALAFYRGLMHLAGTPIDGEEALVDGGYARLWNCSNPNYVELELVARDRAAELLGEARTYDDKTLVYHSDDVEEAFARLSEAAEPVLSPSGEPYEAPAGTRYAQLRAPDGTLFELQSSWIPGFGSTLGADLA
jgi:predicted enzyme related to lactoylglutathione lyase